MLEVRRYIAKDGYLDLKSKSALIYIIDGILAKYERRVRELM